MTLQSGISDANGRRSPRLYSPSEVAAAKRQSLAHGRAEKDTLGGAIFWACGPYWPTEARQMADRYRKAAADLDLVADAMDREWVKPWGDT